MGMLKGEWIDEDFLGRNSKLQRIWDYTYVLAGSSNNYNNPCVERMKGILGSLESLPISKTCSHD